MHLNMNPYNYAISNKDAKKIIIDNKLIGLSVGESISFDKELKCSLLINVHYDSEHSDTLTMMIPQIENFSNKVALNPNFKSKKIIKKLRELNLISDTIEKVNFKNKEYEIIKVNINELKLYKPFGDTVLNYFKENDNEKII